MEKRQGKSFLLRLDAETMELVEKWAAQEFRSVNGQLQWIVAESLKRHKRLPSKGRRSADD
jgi:hypothetical protein